MSRNCIIVSSKKSGSTFLQEALNSHPSITCYDEMFMTRGGIKKRRGQFLYSHMKGQGYNRDQYIKWLFSHKGSICFRLVYPHLWRNKELIDIIKKNDIPVIHLIRGNIIAHYVSSKTKKKKKVRIDNKNMLGFVKKVESSINYVKNNLNGLSNYIEVYYEDMFGKSEGEIKEVKKYGAFNIKSDMITYISDKYNNKICDIFGVERQPLYSNVTKRNSWDISDHIKNVGNVRKALKNTKWEGMI